ncbi:hypothetical protein Taro_049219 [Colocasia esculenta]|uniref:Uncharacterized protein n=1 Tax=Colocasia esculenta TaxID=4460 RepID=A0A843XAC1_COLES|nr:hypothetical protein [Colocasia esculenta]
MVRGARSGSSSGRRMSSERGSSTTSVYTSSSYSSSFWSFFCASSRSRLGSVYTSSSYSSRYFTPPPPTVPGPSVSAPLAFLAGASTVPEVEDAVSTLQEGGGSFYDGTLREG